MQQELEIIKNNYGDKMMDLCLKLFSNILEEELVLSNILLQRFEPQISLYDDIVNNKLEKDFQKLIYNIYERKNKKETKPTSKLLNDAGYTLYECKTEEDIQNFNKYYAEGEELEDLDLDKFHIFFAVKKDVDKINREDFPNPKRQDRYGTSVVCIKFTKDENHILSIKNRYNKIVNNPDATFSNNLDNIIEGLTDSFEKEYGLHQKYINGLEIPDYVMANDGKYYKYNYKINDIYYCSNNIIIDNLEVKRYPQDRYLVMDKYILDLDTGKIKLYKSNEKDSFIKSMDICDKVEVHKEKETTKLIFKSNNEQVAVIVLDEQNNIIEIKNEKVRNVEDNFLDYSKKILKVNLSNVEGIGNNFIPKSKVLHELSCPNVKIIKDNFLESNEKLENIDIKLVEEIGNNFLKNNNRLKEIDIKLIKRIGNSFLSKNNKILEVNFSLVEQIGDSFLESNKKITNINFPNVIRIGNRFLYYNKDLSIINCPLVKIIGDDFLEYNLGLKEIDFPLLEIIGHGFIWFNKTINKVNLSSVKEIGCEFLFNNQELEVLNLNEVEIIGDSFMPLNTKIKIINIPKIKVFGDDGNEKVLSIKYNFAF